MKLQEMSTRASAKKLNKVVESRFGYQIDFDNLTFQDHLEHSKSQASFLQNSFHSSILGKAKAFHPLDKVMEDTSYTGSKLSEKYALEIAADF